MLLWIWHFFDVITFDVFDTLVERDVEDPTDIFRIAGENILGQGKSKVFINDRIAAEKKARKRRADREVTIYEIYKELSPIYKEKCSQLMQAELQAEIKSCHSKEKNVALMKKCLESKKKVYLISDMYLPAETISQILSNCLIDGYRGLYVSGSYRKNKLSGELFRVVAEENELKLRHVLHIGDSIRADFFGAKKAGAHAVLVRRKRRLKRLLNYLILS